MLALVSLLTSSLVRDEGSSSRTEVTKDSVSVGVYGSFSMVTVRRSSEDESEGWLSDIHRGRNARFETGPMEVKAFTGEARHTANAKQEQERCMVTGGEDFSACNQLCELAR